MTSQVLIATAALLVAAFAPTPLPSSKKAPRGKQTKTLPDAKAKKGKQKRGKKTTKGKTTKGKTTKGKKGAKLQPLPGNKDVTPLRFKPLLTAAQIARLAKVAANTQHKPEPTTQDDPSAVRTVAKLNAANPRDGDASLSFQCAYLDTREELGEEGLAMWPHHVLKFCRQDGTSGNPGVVVNFTAEPDSVYHIDCASAASTDFEIRHRMGAGVWSSTVRDTTRTPSDFLFVDEGGPATVEIVFDPPHNHILTQGIRSCRVNKIG